MGTRTSLATTDAYRPANAPNSVRTPRKRGKPPDSPSRSARQRSDEPNGCGNRANRSSIWMDTPSIGCDMEMAEDEVETISMHPIESKLPNPLTIDTNGCANESDESRNHEGTPNMCTHAITPVYEAENISTHSNEPQTRNSPASTGKPHKGETDSVGSHVDALNWRTDILNIETHAERTEIGCKTVSICTNASKTQNLPIEAVKQHSDSPNGARDHTDGSSVRMDMHNAGYETGMIKTRRKSLERVE